MDIVQRIKEEMKEAKAALEDPEYQYKANSLDRSVHVKKYDDIKNVDLNSMFRNAILLYCIAEDLDKYQKLYQILQDMDFSFFYKEYEKHHTPTSVEIMELVKVDRTHSKITVAGKRAFIAMGMEDFYSANLSLDDKSQLLLQQLKRRNLEDIRFLFQSGFLEDLLEKQCGIDLNYDSIESIKHTLYSICLEIYDIKLFEQTKDVIFRNAPGAVRQHKMVQFKNSRIVETIGLVYKIYHNILALEQENKDQLHYEIFALEQVLTYLKDPEVLIQNMDHIDYKMLELVDSNAYQDIFKIILQNQEKRYKIALTQAIKSKAEIENSAAGLLLRKYNIAIEQLPEDIQKSLLQEKNLKILDENMKALHIDHADSFSKKLYAFLTETSVKQMHFYTYLLHMGFLKKETLLHSIEQEKQELLKENAECLLDENVSAKSPNYEENILFLHPEELKANIKLLSWYPKEKKANNFNYLYDSRYVDLLDFFIEQDIDLNLLDDCKLSLEQMEAFIKRVQICSSLDIDIYTKSGHINRSFLLGKGFYCDAKQLDAYMLYSSLEDQEIMKSLHHAKRDHINDHISMIDSFKKLEVYKREDEMAYVIDDLVISRPKVMRNLTYFYEQKQINSHTILQSILYNSNFNDAEIKKIENIVLTDKKTKQKV